MNSILLSARTTARTSARTAVVAPLAKLTAAAALTLAALGAVAASQGDVFADRAPAGAVAAGAVASARTADALRIDDPWT
ncbi:hypothetical protein [Kitasatospora sp. NPDC047058]|uniref:hypothetical protein n=1 Tax=Kitasatospora sp. NPDC047058 TaxID=3155620 RepID=UPI0033E862CB